MNRRISVGVMVALVLMAVTITFSVTMIFSMRLFDQKVLNVKERAAMYNKLSEIDSIVRANHYFDIDEHRLYDAISMGYISGLGDRDSIYLSPTQVIRRNESTKGMEISLGFEPEKNANGYITVTNIRRGSSAAELGLLEGDTIVSIEGWNILENGYDETVSRLRGAAGSKVMITYTRDGEETEIELTRELIETAVVFADTGIEGVGYIRIKTFNDNTENQFSMALSLMLRTESVKGLIIDLRDTNGGYDLDSVANMLAKLTPVGAMITGTFADGTTKTLYTSDGTNISIPIVVLVNENTIGFSELFAGVLGDQDNCKIVGMVTYGKGTLQQLSMLSDGSALDLTIAILNTPVLGSFDRVGIKPDYEVDSEGYVFSDYMPDERLDPQLKKAVEVLNSMI